MNADSLLTRAKELLECPEVSEINNFGLLQSFVASEVQGVLVCKGARHARKEQAVAAEPAEPTPVAAAATEAAPHAGEAPAGPEAAPRTEQPVVSTEQARQQAGMTDQNTPTVAVLPSSRAIELHICLPEAVPNELEGCPAVHFTRNCDSGKHGELVWSLLPAGPSLSSLHLLLTQVVAPLIAAQQTSDVAGSSYTGIPQAASSLRPAAGGSSRTSRGTVQAGGLADKPEVLAELLAATHKFVLQVAACAKHVNSEVAVQLPDVNLQDVAAAARSEDAVLACEKCMEEWVRLLTAVLQRKAGTRPAGRGPLAELEFWQARSEVFGSLLDQLSVPAVRATQAVVEAGGLDANLVASYRAQLSELTRLTLEARDNARFLATMERHFRTLASGGLRSVVDAMQPMLNALRMIWVVSRYYGDDVHMSNLLERIANGLQDRLDGALDMGSLFRMPVAQSLELVHTCHAIAEGWQAHYMSTRERIETSGHHARWEFSKQLLFERTNYAAEVCKDLSDMLQAVDDFRQFLGPELKAVTGDIGVIDEVSAMVQAMVEPVESVGFNPLDRSQLADWRGVRARFVRDADDIKLATRDLIDTCFRKLRSVDAAAELLHSFQRIQAQGAMQQQMSDKLAAVLEHFVREIHSVRRLFEEGREAPPLTRNMPPVAGSIKWSRGLLVRLRRTWLRLQALNSDLEGLEAGRRGAHAMRELSKEMLAYEKGLFAGWSAMVEAAVTTGMRQPLLSRQAAPESSDGASDGVPASVVAVHFPSMLLRVMREAKYLDQLGFEVPQLAVNLALQEGQIREHFQALRAMLERHRGTIALLHSTERALLRQQLGDLEAALEPGLTRINWTSLTIPQFVSAVNKAVDQLAALVAQVQNNTTLIEKTISHISRAHLILPDLPASDSAASPAATAAQSSGPPEATPSVGTEAQNSPAASTVGTQQGPKPAAEASPHMPDLQEFVEDFEHHRQQVVEGLVARYRSVGPLLIKVEELVAGTATGKSPQLAGYYAYWERRLFGAVNAMVVSGLHALHKRMQSCRPSSVGGSGPPHEAPDADSCQQSKPPLFQVALSLIQSEVVVAPSTAEVSKALSRLLHNLAESAKPFVRWMDGTCIEAPEQHVYGEDADPFVFSFFSDVRQSPAVIQAMLMAQQEVQRATVSVARVAASWRSYGVLWRVDRDAALAKFRTRKVDMAAFEERMAQYHRVGEEAWAAGGDADTCFIRVQCGPVAAAVRSEAQAWVRGIAQVMAEPDVELLAALNQQAASLLGAVQAQPQDEAAMQRIQEAIAATQQAWPGVLAAFDSLDEHIRARLVYAAPADMDGLQAELVAAQEARSRWQQLQEAAADRETQGFEVQPAASRPDSQALQASLAEEGSHGRRSSLRRGSLLRTASSASSSASLNSKRKPSSVRIPSRVQQQAVQ